MYMNKDHKPTVIFLHLQAWLKPFRFSLNDNFETPTEKRLLPKTNKVLNLNIMMRTHFTVTDI